MSLNPTEYLPEPQPPLAADLHAGEVAAFRWGARLMGGIVAATLLAGCTDGPRGTEPTAASTAATASEGPLDRFESPYGACNPSSAAVFGLDSQQYITAAQKCMSLYSDTKVALVDFDLPAADAQTIATQLGKRIETTTSGDLGVKITVVQASKAAKALFRQQNPDGCVDESDPGRYGSYDASAVMPELKQYDKLIGVSNMKSCDGQAEGVATPLYARYGEVFNAEKDLQAIKANDGRNKIITDLGNGAQRIQNLQNPADIAAHELLHEFGLGHAGTVQGNTSLEDLALQGNQNEASINLNDFVAGSTYEEYGDATNIMGNVAGLQDEAPLTTVQQYLMAWPELALHESTPQVTVNELDHQQVSFGVGSSRKSIAVLSLPSPLTMPSGGHSDVTAFGKEQKFDTIAFVPQFDDNSGGIVWATDIYLTSQDRSTASLGTLYCANNSETGRYDLTVGGRNIAVTFHKTGVTLQVQQ